MPELTPISAVVVACHAEPPGVDAAVESTVRFAGAASLRVAPDEGMLVGPPALARELIDAAAGAATSLDDDALVLDATDGWSVWSIEGDRRLDAFARVSQVRPAPAFAQGEVGHVPAKVLFRGDAIVVLVPSMWAGAVHARLLADCADLGIRERTAPRAWDGALGSSG